LSPLSPNTSNDITPIPNHLGLPISPHRKKRTLPLVNSEDNHSIKNSQISMSNDDIFIHDIKHIRLNETPSFENRDEEALESLFTIWSYINEICNLQINSLSVLLQRCITTHFFESILFPDFTSR